MSFKSSSINLSDSDKIYYINNCTSTSTSTSCSESVSNLLCKLERIECSILSLQKYDEKNDEYLLDNTDFLQLQLNEIRIKLNSLDKEFKEIDKLKKKIIDFETYIKSELILIENTTCDNSSVFLTDTTKSYKYITPCTGIVSIELMGGGGAGGTGSIIGPILYRDRLFM